MSSKWTCTVGWGGGAIETQAPTQAKARTKAIRAVRASIGDAPGFKTPEQIVDMTASYYETPRLVDVVTARMAPRDGAK